MEAYGTYEIGIGAILALHLYHQYECIAVLRQDPTGTHASHSVQSQDTIILYNNMISIPMQRL